MKEKTVNIIAVKNKADVVRAAEILKKYALNVFHEELSAEEYLNNEERFPELEHPMFLKADSKDSWRVQSHYMGEGVPIDNIEGLIESGEATFRGEPFNTKISPLSREEKVEAMGYTIVCHSPLEIESKNGDGTFARYAAADVFIDYLVELYNEENDCI